MGKKIMSLDREVTNIVQLPAIIRGGVIELLSADLLKLEEKDLKMMAVAMGGELVFMKLRATYTELETPLCGKESCYRPVKGVLYCDDHDRSQSNLRSINHGIVNPRSNVG